MNPQKRKREKGLLAKKLIQTSNAFDLGATYMIDLITAKQARNVKCF